MPFPRASFYLLVLPFLVAGCSTKRERPADQDQRRNIVVIGIEGDVDIFNPVFASEAIAGEINDLLYPSLISSDFDTARGVLRYGPLLAKAWSFQNNDRDLVFWLRSDAKWKDGVRVTARDVQFSYELYGDSELGSVRQSAVEGLRKSKDGSIDVSKSIEVRDDTTVVFHFERPYAGQLFDAGLPIVPAHVFEKVPRKELRTHDLNRRPVEAGPFELAQWKPMQEIVLTPNPSSVSPYPAKLSQLIFRILPDYQSRLSHLRTGEIDLLANLKVEDAQELERSSSSVRVTPIPGRRYHFVGWNNIDQAAYATSKGRIVLPHPLFGSVKVRRALTLAINRKEMTSAFLGKYGQEANGPISPLFRWAYNDTIRPLPFDPQAAMRLLVEEGWRDRDGDGTLEKGEKEFSFTLKIPAGDPLRANIANVVQQQLRAVKIAATIEQVERSVFWQDLMQKKYDAWIAGFEVPLQLQLDDLWGSDLRKYPFNVVSYQDKRAAEILRSVRLTSREIDAAQLWKELQVIFLRDQPCTFLFWVNNLVGVNQRVRGTKIGILGITHAAWDWYVSPDAGKRNVSSK